MHALEPGEVSAPETWQVEPGDHLWGIAEEVLSDAFGRRPSDAEVVPYWQALIVANHSRLIDPTNADLIVPEQQLVLPPPPSG
jgi:hypothetical protein